MSNTDNLFAPRFSQKDVTIHKKERIFKSYFAMDRYEVSYNRFNGGRSAVVAREIFERDANAVAVLAYDKNTDEIALIEQFRPGALSDKKTPWLIEIAAGMIDAGETPTQAAVREANEELNLALRQEDLIFVSEEYSSPGGISEKIFLYIAPADLSHLGAHGGLEDESEDIRIFRAKLEDAYENIKKGRIKNSVAMIAIMYMMLEKENILKFIK